MDNHEPTNEELVNVMVNGEEFEEFRNQMITAYGMMCIFTEDMPPFDEWLEQVIQEAVEEAVVTEDDDGDATSPADPIG